LTCSLKAPAETLGLLLFGPPPLVFVPPARPRIAASSPRNSMRMVPATGVKRISLTMLRTNSIAAPPPSAISAWVSDATFSQYTSARLGCSRGPMACTNLLTVRRDQFEALAAEFTAEWNRLQVTLCGDLTMRKAELDKTKGQIERLVDALVNGTPASAVKDRLRLLEDHRLALEVEIETAVAPAPRLRAVEQPKRAALILEKPPPHTPQRIRPENRC